MSDETPTVEERRRRRAAFLQTLYHVTDGRTDVFVNLRDVGAQVGLDPTASWEVRRYLGTEGLLTGVTGDGGISITHEGVKLVESWQAGPDERLHPDEGGGDHIHIGTAINTQIQQGSDGASQRQTVGDQTLGDVRGVVSGLRQALPNLDLPAGDRAEVEAQLATAEAQLGSRKPRLEILRTSLTQVKDILDAAATSGSAAAKIAGFVKTLVQLLPLL